MRGTQVPLKVVGRKRGGLGGFKTFMVIRCGRREGIWVGLNKAVKLVTASWHC
jgi:hypothetical protein